MTSDKYGRKLSGIIGVLCYVAYFFGMANSTSMAMGYAFAVIGGIANSFLDTCVSPTCMEIYVNLSLIHILMRHFLHIFLDLAVIIFWTPHAIPM